MTLPPARRQPPELEFPNYRMRIIKTLCVLGRSFVDTKAESICIEVCKLKCQMDESNNINIV